VQLSDVGKSRRQEVRMRVSDHSPKEHRQQSAQTSTLQLSLAVSVAQVLCSRTRARRRRRKRDWGAL
jgi:hypothetical protein